MRQTPPPTSESLDEEPNPEREADGEKGEFVLNKFWLIIGLAAILVGIASGFIMSSFTLAR